MLKLIECPRDAMQGLTDYVPAKIKAEYINLLLQVGFDTIDFGSFVSVQAVPQLRDTTEVLHMLHMNSTSSKLLAIVANLRGIQEAVKHEPITYLGFPFSISETFQNRNTNSSIEQSLETVQELLNSCYKSNKQAVIYLSMAFGNPYGDVWNTEIAEHWTERLASSGAKIISLADTSGVSTPENINYLFSHLQSTFPHIEFGVHLHSNPSSSQEKIDAAWNSGCRRFDSALKGFGGCPMASDRLTGNTATDVIISLLEAKGEDSGLDMNKWEEAMDFSSRIFGIEL